MKILLQINDDGSVKAYRVEEPAPVEIGTGGYWPSDPLAGTSAGPFGPREDVALLDDGPLARAVRQLVINQVKRRAGYDGAASDAKVCDAVAQVEADTGRPLLDWITNGGLKQLIEIILAVLAML